MNLDLMTLIGLLALSFCFGAGIMHFFKKRKIKKLKEELIAYKRSADGLWELNEQRLKKSKQQKDDTGNRTTSTEIKPSALESNQSDSERPTNSSLMANN